MRRTCLHCPGSSRTDELVENTAQDGLRRGQKSIEISHAPRRTILDQCVGSGRSRAVWISRLHVLHASLYVLGQILSPTISRDLPRSPAISHFEISGRSREIEPAISPTCDVIDQKLRLSANFPMSIACRGRRRSPKELSDLLTGAFSSLPPRWEASLRLSAPEAPGAAGAPARRRRRPRPEV